MRISAMIVAATLLSFISIRPAFAPWGWCKAATCADELRTCEARKAAGRGRYRAGDYVDDCAKTMKICLQTGMWHYANYSCKMFVPKSQ